MNPHTVKVDDGVINLTFFSSNGVRVNQGEGKELPSTLTVPELPHYPGAVETSETGESVRFSTGDLTVEIEKPSGRLRFKDGTGKTFLMEPETGARETREEELFGHALVSRRQRFVFQDPDESLHGLGHQMGVGWNFRGKSVDLLQENTTIVVPFLYSSAGYGILWDNASHSALGNPIRPIPTECLHAADGSGNGVIGEYFRDAEMTDLKSRAKEPQIRKKWWAMVEGWHKHHESLEDAFYIRWTGYLSPLTTGLHTLYLDLPAGGRLWVGEDCVIDSRGSHKRHQADLILESGKQYPIKLEASQGTSWLGAYAYLQWQEPVEPDQFSFWSQHAPTADYYVIAGEPNEILSTYNRLTGPAPLMPRYVFGYWQSRERYQNSEELVGVVEEHRKRDIPIDIVVQDWRYWEPHTWGEPWFDPDRYPDHPRIFADLHERLHCNLMLSNYAQIAPGAPLYDAFFSRGYLLPKAERDGGLWIDPYNPEAVQAYWEHTREVFFESGVDIFWLDTTEPKIVHPLTPESLLEGLTPNYTGDTASVLNAFSFYLCRGYYEAQRKVSKDRRVCLLPRSGFAGQQRYATAIWSGDTEGNWEALQEQVPMALNMGLSGIPYWNSDIGGFFGDDPETEEYRELFIRWFQFACFNPIMRNHGTNLPKEIWRFGESSEQILHEWIDFHYQLLPYFYSLAWENHKTGLPFMRPLLLEFPQDEEAHQVHDSFLLGASLLVCPVLEQGVTERQVYLPGGTGWYDFWTENFYPGGQAITAPCPLKNIPLFVRAGSILPIEPNKLSHTKAYTGEHLELRVYPGTDASFILYEDHGDGYQYEDGEYRETLIRWDQSNRKISVSPAGGKYVDGIKVKTFQVRFPGESNSEEVQVEYPHEA
ncbi:MAG: TIM-barrel domain-containing protein [Puniceicoccaceae bacterium]